MRRNIEAWAFAWLVTGAAGCLDPEPIVIERKIR